MKKIVFSVFAIAAVMVGCKDNDVDRDEDMTIMTQSEDAEDLDERTLAVNDADADYRDVRTTYIAYDPATAQRYTPPREGDTTQDNEDAKAMRNSTSAIQGDTKDMQSNNKTGMNTQQNSAASNRQADNQQYPGRAMNTVNKMSVTYKLTRSESDKMAADFEKNVGMDKENRIVLKDYPAYTNMRNQVTDLTKSTAETEMAAEKTLRQSFDEFTMTIPDYLLRNDVKRAIRDVEKELNRYEDERAMATATPKQNRKNVERIQKAFDDLEEEIMDARKKFKDNRADALEEFMEELNDNDGRSREARYKDAMEEYNEEIED